MAHDEVDMTSGDTLKGGPIPEGTRNRAASRAMKVEAPTGIEPVYAVM